MSLEGRAIDLVEDDPIMGESLMQRLAIEGASARWWRDGREALGGMKRDAPEAVVCDIRLPDLSGEDIFRQIVARRDAPPFLFITGYGDVDQAVRLLRGGAGDYVTKPFEMGDFLRRLSSILPPPQDAETGVLGVSKPIRSVEQTLRKLAKGRTSVLLTGETGSGKEVAARLLHDLGSASAPFMAVNCAAIPADLMEAELFGHERGAFTGATQRHLGYAERAKDGTLFLDEIGDLGPQLQAKLLRLLEERTFHRVGGEHPLAFKARVIAATNADLADLVRQGRFREDLYYRIAVVNVGMPPLRDRPEDVRWLLDRFVAEALATAASDLAGISALAEDAALAHAWPGNVRELRNRVERAVALSLGPWISPGDLFPERWAEEAEGERMPSLNQVRSAAEKRHIYRALHLNGGEIIATAEALGISRTTLWEKMRKLEIGSRPTDPS
jgi:DNA-binding NtrC family response regulator